MAGASGANFMFISRVGDNMLRRKEINAILRLSQGMESITAIARKTGLARNTVKKYLRNPEPRNEQRTWRTRKNPFESDKEEIRGFLDANPGLEAKTIFEYLCEKHPERYTSGQLRTLQRHIRILKTEIGPNKEVMFSQTHPPGELGCSDFTHMESLKITIGGQPFDHLLYHFVLAYSNWEWARICFSESFQSLSMGLQVSLTTLGGVPKQHLTDSLAAAVSNLGEKSRKEFRRRYNEMLSHFGMEGRATQPYSPNENGDVEQRNYRLKRAVDQALILRSSRDFQSREKYQEFLYDILIRLNRSRMARVKEELEQLSPLPRTLLPEYVRTDCRVTKFSLIHVKNCRYSVPSRLIGQIVEVRIFEDHIEVWLGGHKRYTCPRLPGRGKHNVDYRHVIDGLRRKPGAFRQYTYQECCFPTTTFRMVYDQLRETNPLRADKIYLEILYLAASSGQDAVEDIVGEFLRANGTICPESIQEALGQRGTKAAVLHVNVTLPDPKEYDSTFGLGGIKYVG